MDRRFPGEFGLQNLLDVEPAAWQKQYNQLDVKSLMRGGISEVYALCGVGKIHCGNRKC